jgi:diamine N-acetyltransferase
MPDVQLVELTKDNWQAVADLKVAPDQTGFVADNLTTIAESQFYPNIRRSVIMADGLIVGLAAWGAESDSPVVWLHRFMIAAEHQRRGIGREALRQLVAIWRHLPGIQAVKVSYEPTNSVAEDLYRTFGFVPGGMAEWGERVASLSFTDR